MAEGDRKLREMGKHVNNNKSICFCYAETATKTPASLVVLSPVSQEFIDSSQEDAQWQTLYKDKHIT